MNELLSTKLFIPRPRTNLVPRPRLVEYLNAGLDKELTLISAPAGFGKTTLLSEWIPQSPRCVTWLSLDEGDNDSTRFWAYFISSLQGLRSDLGDDALTLLQSLPPPPITSILTALINDLAAFTDVFAIVLDDYHLVDSEPIHEALAYLIVHSPGNMHLVITTRIDPPLPLARLRARDKLKEIRSNDLRFTVDEVAAFLTRTIGLNLLPHEVAALKARTEGWIAGLQIAALSMQGHDDISGFIRAFSGSHRHILGYLADEVLNQRPKGTLDFLLHTSILERLCGPLCDAVTGESGGQAILENLHHANLFITPLDDEGRWYRYHHLFAEVLQARLGKNEPGLPPRLHTRASEWFERSGLQTEAVEHSLQGLDWSRAIRLIEANMEGAQLRGEMTTLLRWLGTLPDEAIHARPTLGLDYAWLLVLVDDFVTAEQRLAVAEHALRSNPTPDAGEQAALLGQAASVREVSALMLEYPGEVTMAAGREALALLPESNLARRGFVVLIMGCAQYLSLGNVQAAEGLFKQAVEISQAAGDAFTEMVTLGHLSQMRAIRGQLQRAEEACDRLMRQAKRPGGEQIPAAGLGRVMKGRILYEQNALQAAQKTLIQGIAEVEGYSLIRMALIGYVLLARVEQALGNLGEARVWLERAWATIQKHHLKQITMPAAAYRVRLMLQFGDLATATKLVQELEPTLRGPLNPALEYDHMTLARVCVALGRLDEARELLARLLLPAEEAGRMARVIEILALQAVTAFAQEDEVPARAALERALILAEPEGFVRSFVDEGEPMRLLLLDYQSTLEKKIRNGHDSQSLRMLAYTDQLLASFSHPDLGMQSRSETMLDPLSERELDVLRLIASGRSNQEIATLLIIAVSTVKSHINNLYGKLGTHRRTQAIAIARELGLL
jgi:LuxR family maltose regulon positive regulatory protein